MPRAIRHPLLISTAFAVALALPLGAVSYLKHAVSERVVRLPELQQSALVLDRNGVLLRPFPIADGPL